ncbi:uncharacterized protein Z518_01131 [Rhinocladiella mackenziei CBS 650.93]|uniref:Uncharacterized protein n=1 Tax=Rhinocladiella mackenziei CBS 650.93 TaxID=1442369 RepID=A0A0D2JKS8_9EURO|nr:uncharacterized protein Z518_01131 [Rhinocladiella mackenziei CBS 650.93]KIX10050.1 hypothetical protein Z518_01131 [Rhinocladiella mackenziei CBS 650.93]
MLLQRTALSEQAVASETKAERGAKDAADSERPLTCMFFFFASQMKRNIQPADQDLVRRGKMADQPTHQLDSMVARIGMHAAHSPLVTKFETYPVEIPDAPGFSKRNPKPSREEVHDTVMLMKFRDKRARQEWIASKEWQEFMQKTDDHQVFRRMPHVRCASSVRGLMDPMDILTA